MLTGRAAHSRWPNVAISRLVRRHPHRFRTPHRSIALFALLLWGFSQFASFSWNVTLSAVSRAVLLRRSVRRGSGAAPGAARSRAFRLRAG